MLSVAAQDESVKPELIAKGVDPMIKAGLDVSVRHYDAVHKLTPEMAADAAQFAS